MKRLPKYRAQLGSISHGTLRTEDLISAFTGEIERFRLTRDQRQTVIAANRWLSFGGNNAELGSELVSELTDILNEYAPPYCYFGAHEGDGSDFGFWPSMEPIEELPRVENGEEARFRKEDCAYVNDHGNVTVFSGTGKVLLELV